MAKLRWFVTGAIAGLAAAAIGQELAKEPQERTWKGTVAGVPYNFRVDEWSAIASDYWNPDNEAIFVPEVIGLGWGINFAALAQRARALMAAQWQPEPRAPEPTRR
jgi:hypothetical protein